MCALRTSLYDKHVQQGAKIVDFAGWDMPVQYKSVKEEVLAVRRSAGVFDVSHMGEFFVEGNRAVEFVDYLVTNNIAAAEMGKAIYSPLCRDNGTVIDDLIVYKLSSTRIMICVNASNIDKDFSWMQRYAPQFGVKFTNRSSDYSLLALQGPQSFEKLHALIPSLPDIPYYSIWEGQSLLIARTGYTGEDGFEIFGPHDAISKMWDRLLQNDVVPCGLAARDVLRLEVCYPLYGHELNDEITPLDAGLGWTVKMAKPDFMGKGALQGYKSRFKLVKLLVEKGIPREGYPVCDASGAVIGQVTSGTQSVVLGQGIALARIEAEKAKPDQIYFIDIRQKKYNATVTTKPFVQGGHK